MTKEDFKAARKLLNLSTAQLGKRVRLSGRTIEKYEQGISKVPGPVAALVEMMIQGRWGK